MAVTSVPCQDPGCDNSNGVPLFAGRFQSGPQFGTTFNNSPLNSYASSQNKPVVFWPDSLGNYVFNDWRVGVDQCCAPIEGTLKVIAVEPDGDEVILFDDVNSYGSAEIPDSDTRIGSLSATACEVTINVNYGFEIADQSAIFLEYENCNAETVRVQIALALASDPCAGAENETQCPLLRGCVFNTCPVDLCSESPAVYVDGEMVAQWLPDRSFVVVNSEWEGKISGWISVPNPPALTNAAVSLLSVLFTPPLLNNQLVQLVVGEGANTQTYNCSNCRVVCDYEVDVTGVDAVVISSLVIAGSDVLAESGPSGSLADGDAVAAFLNSLNVGTFAVDTTTVSVTGTANRFESITVDGTTYEFSRSNCR